MKISDPNFIFVRFVALIIVLKKHYNLNSLFRMADQETELLDYEEEEDAVEGEVEGTVAKKGVKGTYVSVHSSGFRDFLLKPEILRAIVDCGFEHPSEGMNCS